ncbi:sarcoplasmic calcium-binding protein-like [Mercenaria mercenaria]|uniref:sarcoplasmic calcium-binding protein-like n=1 Tax=Mercenaria mercenaria TaxID=6596 RepID=UPI00234E7E1B|nr:sarcoplasmic calcium-binding protein-like [Mercenaria mercenaria]
MAKEFLINKWRLWFRVLDVKGTGQFSREDEAQDEERYAHLSHLNPEQKAEVVEALRRLTDEYYFRGKQGPISEQDFVDMNNEDFKADKGKFEERMKKCFETEYKIFDTNGDGMITKDAFQKAYLGCGHDNLERINKFFQSYNPVDDKVPVKTIADSWVLFTTNEDSSVKDVVREALEAGL